MLFILKTLWQPGMFLSFIRHRFWRIGALMFTVLVMNGCSLWQKVFDDGGTRKPASLTELRPTLNSRVLWSTRVGDGAKLRSDAVGMTPSIIGDAVYAAEVDGGVGKWQLSNGKVLWQVMLKDKLSAGVGSDGTTTVVTTPKGEVIALDDVGSIKWRATVSSALLTPPLVYQSTVVVRTADYRLFAFDADTGTRRWTINKVAPALSLRAPSGLVAYGDSIIAGFPSGRLSAINLKTGAIKWDMAITNPKGTTELERVTDVVGSPVVIESDVCAVTFQGHIACVEAASGILRWSSAFSSGSGAAGDARWLFSVNERAAVVAFNRDTGIQHWRQEKLLWRGLSAPISSGRAVGVGDNEGYVHWLSREDGSLIARVPTDGSAIVVPPQKFDQGIVVQTVSGKLFAIVNE